MKFSSVIKNVVFMALLASASFAQAQTADAFSPSVEARSSVIFKLKNSDLSMVSAQFDQKNKANIIFAVGDATNIFNVSFHNPTEAEWFMQFLNQIDGSLKITLSGKRDGLSPGNYSVNDILTKVEGQQIINIKAKNVTSKDEDKVKVDCNLIKQDPTDATITVLAAAAVDINPTAMVSGNKTNLDDFADVFRTKLEAASYFFGSESMRHANRKMKLCDIPAAK